MSDLVDKTPEVLIKTVNHDIGFPRRHIDPILGYVASRLFSSASDGGLAADKILTKDFNACDKSVKVPDHDFSFSKFNLFIDSPIASQSNFT